MKKLYDFLGILIGSFIGLFLGRSGYTFWHYRTRPELYAMQSAPWYTGIRVQAVFTAAVVAVLLLLRWAIRRRRKKAEETEERNGGQR